MGTFAAIALLTMLFFSVSWFIQQLTRLAGPVLVLLEYREQARLARGAAADLDREYEELLGFER